MAKKSSPGAFQERAIPVSERTYSYLESRVLSRGFNPGDRLTEEDLAEELGAQSHAHTSFPGFSWHI